MIIGNYVEVDDGIKNSLKMSLLPDDLSRVWKRCGMTADYGATYLSSVSPDRVKIQNSLSTILNELIENAAKNAPKQLGTVDVFLVDNRNTILFQVDNYVSESQYRIFQQVAGNIAKCDDANAKYLKALENCDENQRESGIGLLTILNFFNLKMGFKFGGAVGDGIYHVSVQTVISLQES